MEEKSIKKNYIFNTVYQVITICIPLFTAPYLSRVLGANGIGIQSYTNSIVSYFVLFAILGSSTFGQKKIASVRNNIDELTESFWNIVFFRAFMVLITLIAYFIFILFNKKYLIIYVVSVLNIINVFFDITWFYQGIEDFPKIVSRNCIVRITQVLFIFTFVKSSTDLFLYIASLCFFTLIANLWTWFYIPKYIKKPNNKINIFKNLKEMVLLFLPTIATQVYLVLDKSMIGLITNSSYQNGCYEQAEKIVRLSLTVVTSAAAVILPRIANLYNNGNQEKAKEYVYKGYKFVWILAIPILFGLIGIANIFVPVFFGEGYDLAKILIPIFSILVLAVSLAYVTGYSFLIPIGKQNIYTIVVCLSAIINLIMNIILIPKIGAIGAAIASVTAECIGAILQIYYCCRTGLLKINNIFETVWKNVISGIIMFIVIIIIQHYLKTNLISLIFVIIIGGIVYLGLLFLFKDQFLIENIKLLVNRSK